MLTKTHGLVLSHMAYKDTSAIVRIFTRELGERSYIVNGVRSAKSKTGMAHFQTLNQLDLVVYHKENAPNALSRLRERKLLHPYRSIPFDFRKGAIAMYVAELLSKVLGEGVPEPELFDFAADSLLQFDAVTASYGSYHLWMLWQVSQRVGLAWQAVEDALYEAGFNARQREWSVLPPALEEISQMGAGSWPSMNQEKRRAVLSFFQNYLDFHLPGRGAWKAAAVLQQVQQGL